MSRLPIVAISIGMFGVFTAALVGCRTPATQLDLTVASSCPARSDRHLTLVVTGDDGTAQPRYVFENVSWPLLQTLAPRNRDSSRLRWQVEAILRDGPTVLDRRSLAGVYTPGSATSATITLQDPDCNSADAGIDAASFDAPVPVDSDGTDAAAPDAGCGVAPRRWTDWALYYSLRRNPARPDVIEEQGSQRSLDLVGEMGSIRWEEDGARIMGVSGRPTVRRDVALGTRLSVCRSGYVTIEAWLTIPPTPLSGVQRAEVFTFSAPGTLDRSLFTLGMDATSFIAGIDGCDSQMRPLYRFPITRRGVPVHVVYVRRGLQERAFVDGVEVALSRGVLPSEQDTHERRDSGDVDAGQSVLLACSEGDRGLSVPGSRLNPVVVGDMPHTLHLGSSVRVAGDTAGTFSWEAPFAGTYHLLAIYCRALEDNQILEHYCAGPRP